MDVGVNMITVVKVNTLLRMILASPVIYNKPSCYFMGKQRPL